MARFPNARPPSLHSLSLACTKIKCVATQVRKHFSDLYSLVTPGPSYPFLGVSSTGVGMFWACTLGLLFGLLVCVRAPIFLVSSVYHERQRTKRCSLGVI